MDEYTKRMMANAQARQKKLNTKFTDLGLQQKIPLHESQPNIPTENSRNLDEISKLKRKEVHSDSILSHQTYSVKENVERLNTACSKTSSTTRISSEIPGKNSPKFTHKTFNVQKENFEMEIKFNSPDDVRVEVEIVSDCENDDKDSKAGSSQSLSSKKNLSVGKDSKSASTQSLSSKKNPSDSENDDKDSKSSNQSLSSRKDVKSRLKQLGKLYTDDAELSSPIQRTEEKFHEELSSDDKNDEEIPASKKQQNEARKKRLAALASDRNNWEDELNHQKTNDVNSAKTPRKSWKPPAPKPPVQESATKTKTPPKKKSPAPQPPVTPKSDNSGSKSPTKQLKWDKNVLDSLESQGFSRIESTSQKLVFDYTRPQNENETLDKSETEEIDNNEKECLDESIENNTSPVKKITTKINIQTEKNDATKISEIAQKFDKESKKETKPVSKSQPKSPSKNILSKTALFESNSPSKTKDPALLSVSERKALFEKNKGEALIPKAAFAMAVPKPATENTKPTKEGVKPIEKTEIKVVKESKKSPSKNEKNKPQIKTKPESTVKSVSESSGIAGKLKALLHQATTISESQIRNARESEKQRELEMLKNRFNQNKEIIHEEIQEASEHSDIEEDNEQSSSDEDNTEVSETTKMIKQKSKIVTFQRSRESLASLASKTSKTSRKSIESTRLLSVDSSDSSKSTSNTTKRRSSGDSPVVQAVLEDVKRIKVSPPKNGKLYPCLSDIEASTANEDTEVEEQIEDRSDENNSSIGNDDEEDESIADSDIADTSLGREILEAVNRNHNNSRNKRILDESTTTSDISDVLNDMNEYLDEQSTDTDAGPTPPKNSRTSLSKTGTAASHSFNYKRSSTSSSNTSSNYLSSPTKATNIDQHKQNNDAPTHILDGDSTVPLIHTVSFYRRQQSQEQRTPIKKIVRQSAIDTESEDDFQSVCDKENDQKLINEKIQHLMDEVCKQQTVISQASQAINLCTSTIEFSGSSEEVEAERLLLLATQRRQAALHESQRLRIERTLYPTSNNSNVLNVDHCSITISDIVLPLKRDYIRALTAAGGLGHHFLCLIRYAEHVFATPLTATGNPPNPPQICVRIPGTLKLQQVHPEFTITVEVYSMQAHEEVLPHEIKYHIAKDKKSGKLLTPKKTKHSSQDSKLVKPSIQSPAGPNAVRTSSFQLMGYIIFSIKEVNRTQWSLNKVPYISPLEGNIQMRVQCDISVNVEMRGFLTMFEDISGFGAWHRRWCYLKGESLSYWKYPDDERKKAPINSINLQGCITENVNLVSRDICARPNTFLLEFVRPRQPGDAESLVMVIKKDQTLIRHLLSADTKEERIEWCQQLNKALLSIKSFK
ncbi:anillin-like isoform X2 [Chrysoperla carnea]|uniref:anillin-like isoform X2 n=1 Tax=Chrysoperla carnea TaxID=189513 RepID=UPI001D06FC17|nr:anillin-like isoform X2 [Chrysoperla carnea]